jgi:hypothetical protein
MSSFWVHLEVDQTKKAHSPLNRSLWKGISHITKDSAKKEYITLLVKICPGFHEMLEERKRQMDEDNLKRFA